jgi:glycosyltransferase involved in cell wall biosynthesis
MTTSAPHVGFVLEQALGHVTHSTNLKRLLPRQPAISASIFEVEWDTDGLPAKVPVFKSNWTVRAGVRARRGIRRMHRDQPLDVLFIHTQVPAMLSPDWMRRIPTVVSLDATPQQYDALGDHYDHHAAPRPVEGLKRRVHRGCFRRAAHIVSWSTWAKRGLVDDYGIDAAKVTVIPPGVLPRVWSAPRGSRDHRGVQILFVGADAERKGGDLLLAAFRALQAERSGRSEADSLQLHLVTKTPIPAGPGIVVHRDLGPNSAELVELYRTSDIFCLPTRGDCLPMALSEAGAAGLPLVSSAVAGVPEIVREGETGLLVAPGDRAGLQHALRTLIENPAMRQRLGEGACALVQTEYDAETNASRLAALLVEIAARGAAGP